MESTDKYVAPQKVKDHIMGRTSQSFFTFAERVIQDKKLNGAVGTYNNFRGTIAKIKRYTKDRDLILDEITVHWLKNYEMYLRSECQNKTNTIHKELKIIRRIINEAISEEILPYEKNPFCATN
nr:phage integrase SAM-like domain-containing protein [Bacteroidota bacterium]